MDIITEKRCTKCGEIKPLSDYYKDKRKTLGVYPACKLCHLKTDSESYYRNRDARLAQKKEYHKSYLKIDHAKELKKTRDKKYRQTHKDQIRERDRAYKKTIPNKIYEYNKKYTAKPHVKMLRRFYADTRRSRIKNLKSDLTWRQWLMILSMFVYRCAYCGKETDDLQKDHFIPLTRGGGLTIDNIVPACKNCNCSKNDSMPQDWIKDPEIFNGIKVKLQVLDKLKRKQIFPFSHE